MTYVQWVERVLRALDGWKSEIVIPWDLSVPLGLARMEDDHPAWPDDIDANEATRAIFDALQDLISLGLATLAMQDVPQPFAITEAGRRAAGSGMDQVLGAKIREACQALDGLQQDFLNHLVSLAKARPQPSDLYVVNERVSANDGYEAMGRQYDADEASAVTTSLAERSLIDRSPDPANRPSYPAGGISVRPYYAGFMCA